MRELKKIREALIADPSLSERHAEAVDDLRKIRRPQSGSRASAGFLGEAANAGTGASDTNSKIAVDRDRSFKYCNFLLDCGIFDEIFDEVILTKQSVKDSIRRVYPVDLDDSALSEFIDNEIKKLKAGSYQPLTPVNDPGAIGEGEHLETRKKEGLPGEGAGEPVSLDEHSDAIRTIFCDASTNEGIGGMLVRARKRAGMSQEDVAERMGTNRSNVGRIENGRSTASVSTLRKYAEAVGARLEMRLDPEN